MSSNYILIPTPKKDILKQKSCRTNLTLKNIFNLTKADEINMGFVHPKICSAAALI